MAKHTSKPLDINPLAGVTFDLDGETFACSGAGMSLFQVAEVIRRTAQLTDTPGLNMTLVAESLHEALGPAEYARFTDFVFSRRTDDDTIFEVLQDIRDQAQANIAAAAARPTTPSSGSSTGEPAKEDLPARIINLGVPGGNIRTLDGASPDELEAAAEATRAKPATPPRARKSRSRAAS